MQSESGDLQPAEQTSDGAVEALATYREHVARCQNYWKDNAMIAIFPSMWLGLKTQQNELHEKTEAMFAALKEKVGDADLAGEEIPDPPEKIDPFRLDK